MTKLRRVRLDGIGPTGARFDPVTIDLTDRSGEAARVALINLENGGGKSVLLKLIFAAVLPGRRNTLGGAKLGDFVLSDDTGHVALEWAIDDGHGGEAFLVTGVVLEWRNKTRSSDQSNLRPWWYAFRPVVGVLDLDTLPTRDGSKRPSRAVFRDRLIDLFHRAPTLELESDDGPDRWREWLLAHTPIDPELFAYQRSMNADEADAEELFANIRSGDDFVRMLLHAVVDPAEMHSFGETVGTFAAQLARRDDLELERTFADEATAVLHPLAAAHARAAGAETVVANARRATWILRARIAVDAERSTAEADRLLLAANADDARADELDTEESRLVAQGQELRRREAEFTLKSAEHRHGKATDAADIAKDTAAAWKLVDTVLDEASAVADRRRLTAELAEADAQDAPLHEARDRAVASLRHRLDDEHNTTLAAADTLDVKSREAEGRRKAADLQRREAEQGAGKLRSDADARDILIRNVDDSRNKLRDSGVLDKTEAATDASLRWTTVAIQAETDLTDRITRRGAILDEQNHLREEQHDLAAQLATLRPELTETQNELYRLTALADDLRGFDRVAEVLGEATVDLWARGDSIQLAFIESIAAADAALVELDVTTRADRLALEALGDGGLLPPSADVTAVWEALTAARIPATSGWRWLAERDDATRERILGDHPALTGGIIITDPAHTDRARDTIAATGLDIRSIVTVATPADLDESAPPMWVAPAHRGLYDEKWAEDERIRIEARLTVAAVERDRLTVQVANDRDLKLRHAQLLEHCPPGHLDALGERARTHESQITETEGRSAAIHIELHDLDTELAELLSTIETLTDRQRTATTNAQTCDAQAEHDTDAETWKGEAQGWRARAEVLDGDAKVAETDEDQARGERDAARDQAAEQRRIAADRAAARDLLPIVDALQAPPAEVSTVVLEQTYRAAVARLETESTGTAVQQALKVAEALETEASRRLRRERDEVVAEARQLAATPAAGDQSARSEAIRAAEATATELDAFAQLIRDEIAVAKNTLNERTPRDRARHADLPEHLDPRDRDHAIALAQQVAEEQRAVAEQMRHLRSKAGEAKRASEAAGSRVKVLTAHQNTLTIDDTPIDTIGVEPFDGSLDEAERLVQEVSGRYRQATTDHTAAALALTEAVAAVRSVGNRPTYQALGGVVTALAEESAVSLAARANELAAGLEAIRASIDAELADVNRHRNALVERLSTLVEQNLKLLRLAEKRSIIPGEVGDWQGKPFLTIGFQTQEATSFTARMGSVIDQAAQATKRDATTIVLDAVRAAVVRRTADGEVAFNVTIMKPNAAMFDTTVDVARLSTEFSGGQRLTAAILLYCTLAALRAYVRGQDRQADPGVLFLDNPIGKANADYLLDLQIAVAAGQHVQLVYTTGITSPEVHANFDAIARLRNDADLRRHLNYIVVDDNVADRLTGGHAPTDTNGYVTSTRLASVPPT